MGQLSRAWRLGRRAPVPRPAGRPAGSPCRRQAFALGRQDVARELKCSGTPCGAGRLRAAAAARPRCAAQRRLASGRPSVSLIQLFFRGPAYPPSTDSRRRRSALLLKLGGNRPAPRAPGQGAQRPPPPSAPGLAWASPSPIDPLTYFAQG